ncbi:50S ribosomal protein L6 [Treponema pallidum]|uniref:Large ribosomal subunit protein uL6 n=4 Tax=Treponema pallidum TaxID=160 RepID=RL6_TREPA|nr:50S ribosomal protein L6 [Treponema pallidum]B2S2F1.1 RecName: Full=Large ribosomal subunit protein uL6; AltName: Full=50S ribosomal protein L6 [Treponema pallidum subsp. pallidum SS14]O83234.1 RecName: Full=Large ribosomal subunit protein uL6; AltName: Full=50S ribosomal protein L6 [Treponema pallidum subsp. pallidum str. Nichols]AAC65188.1 ribosomal protein L6 (rplF) [Treponema pallidum subsp. pallidum str. Nichols]ACD70630.1 ribosomal protein L6 [Treponema pallidum subsp. pallidum SS14]A
MSRIGKVPVSVPGGVHVRVSSGVVEVEGPKGVLSCAFLPVVTVRVEQEYVIVARCDDSKRARACHGLYRKLLSNMVVGVSEGFSKTLVITGIGYRAEVQGRVLVMALGYSNDFTVLIPSGIEVRVESSTRVIVSGVSKERVGEFAAQLRRLRLPEAYKGKGIRYDYETIVRKVGKSGVK